MALCRCPHCQATFEVSIPPDDDFWDHHELDEDGMVPWICLDCHKRGLPAVTTDAYDRHAFARGASWRRKE